MKLKSKLLLGVMTPMERARGRYMRAPDHDATGGGNEGSSGAEGQGTGNDSDPDAGLTTAQKLEKEFGQEITPAPDDGSDSSTGNEGEGSDEGNDDGDANNADDDNSSSTADEGGTEGDSEEGEGGASREENSSKKNRAQQRIDELTADARHHEREADKWRRRAEELGYVPDASGEENQLPEEPDPSKYQYGENDLDYIRDLAKFEAKAEVLTQQAEARFKSEAAALDAKWSATQAKHAAEFPDYEEVVVKGAKEQKWHCPPVIAVGIKDSEYGMHIAHKLATNPAESERISKLSPLEQAREFGKLEQDFASNARIKELETKLAKYEGGAGNEGKPAPRIVSKAPEPPKRRVGGGGVRHETPADTDDFAAFDRMADAKLGIKS